MPDNETRRDTASSIQFDLPSTAEQKCSYSAGLTGALGGLVVQPRSCGGFTMVSRSVVLGAATCNSLPFQRISFGVHTSEEWLMVAMYLTLSGASRISTKSRSRSRPSGEMRITPARRWLSGDH